jgi:hypothetical protein
MQCSATPIVRSYRDLVAWKKSMALVLDVYRSTHAFPKLAEGQARLSTGEFKQFLGHARGSLMEVETQILIARELGYIQLDRGEYLLSVTAEVGRVLNGLLNSLPTRT